ncbi:type II toxin-antitoxin system VapC family toxin [Paractinoplanes rhizophilus]|jgi:predicted nucleic acid-binding protein|uniref:Ribonuclease VapC n=1 Tax=Paractinoplanes rhizophilus TaxID=1416877 RepID=A0ABW2HN78_9ACTN|nr:type II toxin-antitoxin system VapC family toxin [Actinoplanes sp.]
MVSYLLDTNVLSEPQRRSPDRRVVAWLERLVASNAEVYLSVLVVGEIRKGIELLRRREPRRAELLEAWHAGLLGAYADRILPVTLDVAAEWGRIAGAGQVSPVDGLIAATAKVHRLTLATRNVADFERTGVRVVNPFDG